MLQHNFIYNTGNIIFFDLKQNIRYDNVYYRFYINKKN